MQTIEADRLAYSINDFAELIGIGRTKVYAEIRDGRLRAKKLGSRTLITGKAASEFISRLPDVKAAA
jgi:excisionase family DNA binding protein